MRPTPQIDVDDELDLPPLDGSLGGADGDEENEGTPDGDDAAFGDDAKDHGDALDDATAESDPHEAIAVEGPEGGWLVDADDARALDVGAFDLSLEEEGRLLEDDGPDLRALVDEELGAHEETVHSDGGEEGPLAADEELREEDLPALDADDDGDVDDASLYERTAMGLGTDEELRWDDRAWARAEVLASDAPKDDDVDDSGTLVVPGDDARFAARDAVWRNLEETGRITAVALVPGDGVVVALDGPERPVLVRILVSGVARIIAEIDLSTTDEVVACSVAGLQWDGLRGCLVATGAFGAQAFRPA